MSNLSQADREFLRKRLVKFMAERFRIVLSVASITVMMRERQYVDFQIDEADVEQAVKVILGKGFIDRIEEDYGATIYYQANDKGIIESERL